MQTSDKIKTKNMKVYIKKPWAKKSAPQWNRMSALERLRFILSNQDVFLAARLVREGEILAARVTPESALEYIIEREESPFFSVLDIKKPLDAQKAGILEGMLTA